MSAGHDGCYAGRRAKRCVLSSSLSHELVSQSRPFRVLVFADGQKAVTRKAESDRTRKWHSDCINLTVTVNGDRRPRIQIGYNSGPGGWHGHRRSGSPGRPPPRRREPPPSGTVRRYGPRLTVITR